VDDDRMVDDAHIEAVLSDPEDQLVVVEADAGGVAFIEAAERVEVFPEDRAAEMIGDRPMRRVVVPALLAAGGDPAVALVKRGENLV